MAASTIARDTWTNDSGTSSQPNGDGTILNNNVLQNHIYARIDAMFAGAGSYATLTLGGKLAAEGFGNHTFNAGGSGTNTLSIRNTSAGTGNGAAVYIGNDASAIRFQISMLSTTYTAIPDTAVVETAGAGGLILSSSHASGTLRLFTAGEEHLKLSALGHVTVGQDSSAATVDGRQLSIVGNGGESTGVPADNHNFDDAILVSSGSGNVGNGGGIHFGAGHNNYTQPYFSAIKGLLSSSSNNTLGDLIIALRRTSTDTALTLNTKFFATGGVSIGTLADPGVGNLAVNALYATGVSTQAITASATAFGVGIEGAYITIGRNSSGNGAAGVLVLEGQSGALNVLWADSSGTPGVLRIIQTSHPVEDGGITSDRTGTIVGTQSSSLDTKILLGNDLTPADALAVVLRTPVKRFRYRGDNAYGGTVFHGIIAEDSPDFAMDPDADHPQGRSFNPVSSFGYSILAFQALAARLAILEAR